jgi:ribose transport system substrate-binding protein
MKTGFTLGALTMAVAIAFTASGALAESKGRIAFSQSNFGNEWWETQAKGAEAEIANLGYDGTVISAQGDPVTQNGQVRTFITQQFDAVIFNPTAPQGLESSIQALKNAGIPAITVNSPLSEELLVDIYCYVSDDQVDNATTVGAEVARVLKEKHGSDVTLKYLLVAGFPGDLNALQREEGFNKGYASVEGAPKLDYLETVYGQWMADPVIGPVRAVSTANPDLAAVFVQTDSMMPGVETALKSVGLWDKVVIGGYDARMVVVEQMMNSPDGPIVATVANRPYEQGVVGAQMADRAINGVPQSEACPGGKYIMDPVLVTPANAAEYFKADAPY